MDLTVSNLLESNIPNWNGAIQAWSARWFIRMPTGTNYDYRVILVNSQISPTTPSQVQDMILHGSNSLSSRRVECFRTFSSDAKSDFDDQWLCVGAGSPAGELNYGLSIIFGPSQMPNFALGDE